MFQVMPDELCQLAFTDAAYIGQYFDLAVWSNLATSVRWCMAHAEFEHPSIEGEILYIAWMADLKSRDLKITRRK